MTVKELIDLLAQFDEDAEIMLSQAGGEYEVPFSGDAVTGKDGMVWFMD